VSPERHGRRSSTSGCASANSASSTGSPRRHPAQVPGPGRASRLLGKFYHRPPGGESWADVILRLRSALDSISLHYADRRVLIVCHQVVVLCLRYILEEMDEAQVLAIDRQGEVLNCGVCEYEFDCSDPLGCQPHSSATISRRR
jgi:broad specificity phosphatase PhoE